MSAPAVALSISTLDRPEGLERTLRSVAAQRADGGTVAAVVVNNSPADRAPHEIAARVAAETGLAIETLDEPVRGVAPPRNRGLARARELAPIVGFLDDDEEAPPGWLAEMLRVKREFRGDVVTGPVAPRFVETPPEWVVRGGFFARKRRPDGSLRSWAFTNNVLFDATLLDRLDRWFDGSFLRLSEDRHFFQRLARTGARIVWADAAEVIDHVPPSRTTEEWLVRRMRTVGRCVAPVVRDLDGRAVAVASSLAKGPVWIAIGGVTRAAGAVGGVETRVRGRSWIAYGVGLLEGALVPSAGGKPVAEGD
jgi:glycosyltransferase involved in cell wall biosynthesis